jgi:hypothetical protein
VVVVSAEELVFPGLTPESSDDELPELDDDPFGSVPVLAPEPESVPVPVVGVEPGSVVVVEVVDDCSCPIQNPAPVSIATTSPPMLMSELLVRGRRPFGLMPMKSPPHHGRTRRADEDVEGSR